jgi:hypothetical protein
VCRPPGAIDAGAAQRALDIVQGVLPGEVLEEEPLFLIRRPYHGASEVDLLYLAIVGLAQSKGEESAH